VSEGEGGEGQAVAPANDPLGHPEEFKGFPAGIQLPFPGMLPIHQVQQVQQVQVWQGQFPPPEAIERYEVVHPGAFDRLIRMAERQQEATIASTQQAMTYQANDVRRGHILGAVVTLAAMAGSGFAALHGATAVAVVFLGVPVMTVAKAFLDSATVNKQVVSQAKAAEAKGADQAEAEAEEHPPT